MIVKDTEVYFKNNIIIGNKVQYYKKLWKDVKSIYKDSSNSNIAEDEVMYEVYTYDGAVTKNENNMLAGVTVIKPLTVNGECNMTRGHFHENINCPEIYIGSEGNGILLLMDEDGNTFGENVKAGSVHYIHGNLAHRLINIGNEDLIVAAYWSVDAGHDYSRVEKNPFQKRVYKNNDGEILFEDC